MLDTAAFPVPQCLTAAEAAVGRQSRCLCHCPHADFSLTGVSISPCRPQAWGLLIWASGQWNFSGTEDRESGQFPATLQMTRSAGSSPESPRAFYQSQLLPLISLPPLPSSTLGPFKLFGVSFVCQWQWLRDTASVTEVLERQITTLIPAIAKEPGDSGQPAPLVNKPALPSGTGSWLVYGIIWMEPVGRQKPPSSFCLCGVVQGLFR